jgi:DNA-binding protein
MKKGKSGYQTFRICYNHIVRELVTDAAVKLPAILAEDDELLWIKVKAVWDTGATQTVITSRIAQRMKLKATGKAIVFGVNSETIVNRYMVDIQLPNKIKLYTFEVLESNLNSPDIDLLVGMDIIQKGDFLISNAKGKTTFSFCIPPLDPPIDLSGKCDRVPGRKGKPA